MHEREMDDTRHPVGEGAPVIEPGYTFGTVTDHGTMFVGFCASQRPLAAMLESMAGLKNGRRDALTYVTKPVSGAYYVVPSAGSIARIAGAALSN